MGSDLEATIPVLLMLAEEGNVLARLVLQSTFGAYSFEGSRAGMTTYEWPAAYEDDERARQSRLPTSNNRKKKEQGI